MPNDLIRVTYTKSAIGYNERQKETVRSLGLRHIGDVVIHEGNSAVLGMVRAVRHLVTVEHLSDADVVARESGSANEKAKGARR